MALKPGHVLREQYEIVCEIGKGGFGYVYQARDLLIGKDVAIKELIPGWVGDPTILRRFLAEARATIELRHERIVATHNVFQVADSSGDTHYYIVMEHMPGGSLEQRLTDAPRDGKLGILPVDDAIQVAVQVCEGLRYAHERGVVHCDLKPANILFDEQGNAKLADFGVAHVSDQMITRTWRTAAGFMAGTLPYMSPEQADGVRDDPRLDLYAVGAILYRLLSGRLYLDFDSRDTPRAQADNVDRIVSQEPNPPSHHNPDIPGWLDAVVVRALAKSPENRFRDAREMRAALLAGSAGLRVGQEEPREEKAGAPVPSFAPPGVMPQEDETRVHLERRLAEAQAERGASDEITVMRPARGAVREVETAEDREGVAVARRRPVWIWVLLAAVASGLLLVPVLLLVGDRRPTPTPRVPVTDSPVATLGTTGAPVHTSSATETEVPAVTSSPSSTVLVSRTAEPTVTGTATWTATVTDTPTRTPTITPSPTASATPTRTRKPTATASNTPKPTKTPTPTYTWTPTNPPPPTFTFTPLPPPPTDTPTLAPP